MKQITLVLVLFFGSSGIANAGFFSDVLSSSIANTLTKDKTQVRSVEDKEKLDSKKIQIILKTLNFYDYKVDGDLNTFDSRNAIKKWQQTKKTGFLGFFEDAPTGILSDEDKLKLLYFGDLVGKFNSTRVAKLSDIKTIIKRKKAIIDEVLSQENGLKINTISSEMKKDLDDFESRQSELYHLFHREDKNNIDALFDIKKKALLFSPSEKVTYNQSKRFCETIDYLGKKWSLVEYTNVSDNIKKRFTKKYLGKTDYWIKNSGSIFKLYWSSRHNRTRIFIGSNSGKKYRAFCVTYF